ncbi:MAG: type II toxin-antitoxin system YafQ family toxin [Ruminococcus sp.]|nr:type II toxin-antitoxin system YafQ family toxin [Ruminococcus sp.]
MLELHTTPRFRKDYKLMKKCGKNMQLLEIVLDILLQEQPLPEKYLDHPLKGNYLGYRECHIQPDWLLIYKVQEEKLVLVAVRTGSHADLFA